MDERMEDPQRSFGEKASLVVAVALVAGVGASFSTAVGSGGGYVFSEMSIEQGEGAPDAPGAPADVTVRYSTAWAGQEFPGWRHCTIRVLAADGSVMGVKRIELVDLTERGSMKTTEVPVHGTDSAREPASATGSCDPGRNDDPDGYWVFSNVSVARRPLSSGDLRTFEMTFDDRWVGSGTPGVEQCTVTAYDALARVLFQYPFNFSDAQRASRGLSTRIVTESDVIGEPASAEVSCNPL